MSDDGHIDHQKLAGPQYLLWYDSPYGFRFGISKWSTLHQAKQDAELFRADGFETRIVKLEIIDGEPVATWI